MSAVAEKAPTTWGELAEKATTTVEFPRSYHEPKGARRIKTEWVLSERTLEGGKVERVVVQLSTSHDKDRKRITSRFGYHKWASEPGSPFTSEFHDLFGQTTLTVAIQPVERYSAAALKATHAGALDTLQSFYDEPEFRFAEVVVEALAKYGTWEEES